MTITSIDIVWTALPAGRAKDTLRATVFVSPRILVPAETTLEDAAKTPLFNWPQAILALGTDSFPFAVRVGTSIAATTGTCTSFSRLDAGLWKAIFLPSTRLGNGAVQNWSQRPVRSFRVKSLLELILPLYRQVASEAPDAAPPVDSPLKTILEPIEILSDADTLKMLTGKITSNEIREVLKSKLGGIQLEFAVEYHRLRVFYERAQDQYDPNVIVPSPEKTALEFHEILNLLSDYPALLRGLGLALDFDLQVTPDLLVDKAATAFRFAPTALPTSAKLTHRLPWTAFEATPQGFYARAATDEMFRGALRLGDSQLFSAYQVDVDGSAIKSANFAKSVLRTKGNPNNPPDTSLPALRGGGITLARQGRGERVVAQLTSAVTKQQALTPSPSSSIVEENLVFSAEDLTRGYRIEVQDLSTSKWMSLCLRSGRYLVGDQEISVDKLSLDRHGFVRSGNVSAQPGDTTGPLFAHEAIFGWDGWSLVAPRPGRSIAPFQIPGDVDEQGNPISRDIPVVIDRTAEGVLRADLHAEPQSLPRLRYGRSYRLRAKTVDLAGNGLLLGDPLEPKAGELTPPLWETTPLVFRRYEPISPPAITPRLPAAEGESAERLVIRSNFDKSAAMFQVTSEVTGAPFPPSCERHFTPPKSTQIQVELHGKLDGIWSSTQASFDLSKRESGNLFRVPGASLFKPKSLPPEAATSLDDAARGDPLQPGQYVFLDVDGFNLPYLPDPLARGLLLRGEVLLTAGASVQGVSVDYGGAWPDLAPARLALVESSDGVPHLQVVDGYVEVALPKATTAQLRLSSTPTSVSAMAMAEGLDPQALAEAEKGRHWMFTPSRTLTLVHAVQQPLEAPFRDVPIQDRQPGDTHVFMTGYVNFHGPSTQRVELRADWTDPVDNPAEPAPTTQAFRAVAFSIETNPDESGFKIYDAKDPGQDPRSLPWRHEIGDTRAHTITYTPEAVSRFREYFPSSWFDTPGAFVREGIPHTAEIPSSARPDAPRIAYIIPTFAWKEQQSSLTRLGRGLRIYLERPWFSSGEGEQLAVLVDPSPPTTQLEPRPFTSHWAADPAWKGKISGANSLRGDSFDSGTRVDGTFSLAEQESLAQASQFRPSLVAYTPQFNQERGLWYVDVELKDPGVPYAFVRLTLARYQPRSIPEKHLSRTVQADFIQVMPDRSASVSPTTGGVTVTVSGRISSNNTTTSYEVVAQLQERPEKGSDLEWRALAGEQALPPIKGAGGTVFLGVVKVPVPKPGQQLRVLVSEYELWVPDPALGLPSPQRRLVFAAPFIL